MAPTNLSIQALHWMSAFFLYIWNGVNSIYNRGSIRNLVIDQLLLADEFRSPMPAAAHDLQIRKTNLDAS